MHDCRIERIKQNGKITIANRFEIALGRAGADADEPHLVVTGRILPEECVRASARRLIEFQHRGLAIGLGDELHRCELAIWISNFRLGC